MKILLNLVKKNILVNKKLFLAIILGISLSVSLIFTIFNVKENLNKSIRKITFKNNGAYHYKIIDVDKSKIDYILNNKLVKDYYYLYVDKNNPDVDHIDNKYIDKKIIKVVKGKLEFDKYLYSENKMLLNIKDASGYFSGYMPYVKFTKIKDYSKVNLYVELKNYKNTKEFENIIKNTKYEKNEGIYDYYDGKNDNMKVLNILSYFAIAIVIIASFVIINNSFSISFAEKIKQIGILSSVGATKKQLNTFLKLECFIIGFIGSVLGIIIGITASLILGNYLQNAVKILTDNVMILPNEIHLLSFIVSIILIFVTIYFVIIKLSYKYKAENIMNEKITKALNEQINKEMESAYLYLGMAVHFEAEALLGFAHWMKEQAKEEMEHALKIYRYLFEIGSKPILGAIKAQSTEYGKPIENIKEAEVNPGTLFAYKDWFAFDSNGNRMDLEHENEGGTNGSALLDCSKLSGGCDNKKFRVWVERTDPDTYETTRNIEERQIEKKIINGITSVTL